MKRAGLGGVPRGQFDAARRNFGPRLGIAYRATNKTAIRAASGIIYAPRIASTGPSPMGASGLITTQWIATLDGVTPLNLLSNPFPTGLLQPQTSEADRALLGQLVLMTDRNNKNNNYSLYWNLSVQRELMSNWLAEIAYTGSHGIRNTIAWDFNQADPRHQALGAGLSQQVSNAFFGLVQSGPLSTPTIAYGQLLRPFPQHTGIRTNWENGSSSIYHALQVKAERRFSHGFNLLIGYTVGKLIDDSSGRIFGASAYLPGVQNYYDLRAERGLSAADVAQRLVVSHTIELPFGPGKALLSGVSGALSKFVGGWSLSGFATFHSGFPLVLSSIGNPGVGVSSDLNTPADTARSVLRPNNIGRSAKLEGAGDVQSRLNRYFDTGVFTVPAPFTYGNTGRTLPDVRTPGRRNYDLTLAKTTAIGERLSLQFRAEAYNLTNTPFFGDPGLNLGSSNFGIITSSSGERQMQMSLKLLW